MNPLRILFAILGFIFFALGAIGVFLPILPTTPFLLVASFCFAKSSQRFNDWFLSTKLYQNHLDSFVKERSMTLKTKVSLLAFASTMLIIAFILLDNLHGRIAIACVILVKYYYFIFRIKTISPEEAARIKEQHEAEKAQKAALKEEVAASCSTSPTTKLAQEEN